MAKFIENKYTNSLNEIMQANDIKFAFVNKKDDDSFEAVHVWVKCREYFNEFLMNNHHPDFVPATVHGFNYKKDEYPYDLSATRIALRFPNKGRKEAFLNNLSLLHAVEKANDLTLTVTYEVENPPHKNMLIVEADSIWVQKCLLTNLYTLLIKLASLNAGYLSANQLSTKRAALNYPTEISYLTNATPQFVSNLLNNVHNLLKAEGYVDGCEQLRIAQYVHQSSGLMTMLKIDQEKRYHKFSDSFVNLINTIKKQNTFNYFEGILCQVDAKLATAS